MDENELKEFLKDLHNKNPDAALIVGLSRMNLLTKIGILISGKKDAHEGKLLNKAEVMKVLMERMDIKRHTDVFKMCDIYLMRFRKI